MDAKEMQAKLQFLIETCLTGDQRAKAIDAFQVVSLLIYSYEETMRNQLECPRCATCNNAVMDLGIKKREKSVPGQEKRA